MPSLLEPEYADAFQAWKTQPSPTSRTDLLQTLNPVIEGAVRAHTGGTEPISMGQGKVLALSGLESYDPAKGKLRSHLYNHLQSLRRFNRKQTQPLYVPERLSLERQNITTAEQNLSHELGRDPSDAELSDHLGISKARILRARRANSGLPEGVLDATPDQNYGNLAIVGERKNMWQELVYDDAPPVEQKIMEWSLGLHGQPILQNQEIARRLRLTPGAISQRKQKIQMRLDQEDQLSPF